MIAMTTQRPNLTREECERNFVTVNLGVLDVELSVAMTGATENFHGINEPHSSLAVFTTTEYETINTNQLQLP